LFNFERKFSSQETAAVTVTRAARQSVEERQKDVFESHRHRAFSLAFYMTGSEIEAEEILAGTFVRVFQRDAEPDGFAVDCSLIREITQRFPLIGQPSHEQPSAAISKDADLHGGNVHRCDLEAAIQGLPENERLVFLLRDVEGYSAEAIAKLLQVPQPQVERAAFSARLRLRQMLSALALRAPEAA
jgi:DNA-directed RNA polymerase specialized sigma24 family protein